MKIAPFAASNQGRFILKKTVFKIVESRSSATKLVVDLKRYLKSQTWASAKASKRS